MSRIVFDEVFLNRDTDRDNMVLIQKWISDTTEKLNLLAKEIEERRENGD